MLSAGIDVWLAGGWAEELHRMIDPRPHHDIDLLCRAESFDAVDRFVSRARVTEITAKRFPHKRAFDAAGIMVELILVGADLTTRFWDGFPYPWPPDTFGDPAGRPPLISVRALRHYRLNRPPAAHPSAVESAVTDSSRRRHGRRPTDPLDRPQRS